MHNLRWLMEQFNLKLSLLEPLIYRRRYPLEPFRVHFGTDPLIAPAVDERDWPILMPNSYWGRHRAEFTLRTTFRVPAALGENSALYLPIGQGLSDFPHPEALAYIDGQAWMSVDKYHQELPLPAGCRDGQEHTLALYGWCGTLDEQVLMGQPCLVEVDASIRELCVIGRVALESISLLPEGDPARYGLVRALEQALALLDLREPLGDNFYASGLDTLACLKQGLAQAGQPLDLDIIATGHAHIDVAWHWQFRQTRFKTARSWSNVLRLMDRFPGFHFTQSQPQLYAWLADDHPQLFADLQSRVSQGRWEPTGGMWVEADCLITGAEALVRQLLLGQRFYREHFGSHATPILWLPDSFGFPWSLPQLIVQAGLQYFMSSKISWSEENRFPYDSFWWQGIDGTQVLAHGQTTPGDWRPASNQLVFNYNAALYAREVLGTWTNLQHKDQQRTLLILFGHGDGGGGPTADMLIRASALEQHPGLPRLRHGSGLDFFTALEQQSGEQLPVWNGEIYLEYHRGTYTSQAATKRANRKNEIGLHTAEFLAAWSAEQSGAAYPHLELRRAWELLCLNQFHDILPGSSIAAVYVETLEQHAEIAGIVEEIQRQALVNLAAHAPPGDLLIVNPAPFGRNEPVFVPTSASLQAPPHAQAVEGGFLVSSGPVPAYGTRALEFAALDPASAELQVSAQAGGWVLENGLLRLEIDAAGDLTRIYDQEFGREVLAPEASGNLLQAFEDRPLEFDAWNLERYYDQRPWFADPATSIRVIEEGALRVTLEIHRRILHSDYVQRVMLCADSRRIDFDTLIDWRERHTLLKVAFPVAILAPEATYEIQWGVVARPTHRNTSWDRARFEVPAHKWADLSEGDYGVSLLNDCKYGYDIKDNCMRLTLLRGPGDPDPQADLGQHRFVYSLLPHQGDWRTCTAAAAYTLNYPLVTWPIPGSQPAQADQLRPALVSVDAAHVIIETIKQAEDGRGLIVRLYESQRRRGPVRIASSLPLVGAERCNLLEESAEPLPITANSVEILIKPFEIVTLRLLTRQ